MWKYETLLVLHLMFVILWLGPDLFSWYVWAALRKPRYDVSGRMVLTEVFRALDQYSRTATILLIPTGIGLLRLGGFGLQNVPVALLWLATGVCFLWVIGSVWITGIQRSWKGMKWFAHSELVLRVMIVIVALIMLGTSIGSGDTVNSTWLLIKITIFAWIMLAAIAAFLLPNPFVMMYEMSQSGATPAQEVRFTQSIDRIMWIVVAINTTLIVMIITAVARL